MIKTKYEFTYIGHKPVSFENNNEFIEEKNKFLELEKKKSLSIEEKKNILFQILQMIHTNLILILDK